MEKVLVYTANCGGYDAPRDDILCFTEYSEFKDPRRNSRIYKILPHLWLPDCDWSIWVDANIYLKVPPEKLVERAHATGSPWCVFAHNFRKTLWEEFDECRKLKKDDPVLLDRYERYLRARGDGSGLAMCGIQVRHMISNWVARRCEEWWGEYCRWSVRDQLSFPGIVGHCLQNRLWPKVASYNNEWFRLFPHGRKL